MVDEIATIVCPLCATAFDSDERAACSACPLGKGCNLVCCPNCGTTMVDPRDSKVAGWMMKRIHKGRGGHRDRQPAGSRRAVSSVELHSPIPLTDAPIETELVVSEMQGLPPRRQRHLRSYGLAPGCRIRALSHNPLTVILIDHTELALENVLAQAILVQRPTELP